MQQQEGFSYPASQLLLSYSLLEEEEADSKKRLPNPVTIPKKGPLVLQTSKRCANKVKGVGETNINAGGAQPQAPARATHRLYTNPSSSHHRPKHSLTRFPVLMLQRPIEEIENQLGKISCADLTENVKLLSGHQAPVHTVPPLMKYPSWHTHLHSNHQPTLPPVHSSQQYTHHEEGLMNISITYSRHLSSHHSRDPSNMTSPQKSCESHTSTNAELTTESRLPSNRPVTMQAQRLYLSSSVRPSIAPQAVRAAVIHKVKPITASTVVRGRRIIRTHF